MKNFLTSIFIILLFMIGTNALAQSNKNIRKSSNKSNMARGTPRRNLGSTNITTASATVTQTTTSTPEITETNCDHYYTLCMNKVCSDDKIGKCICYEDKFTNTTPAFKLIDGMRVKQGFDMFEYARKDCLQILDKCMDNRRSITEKYKNSIQRDCLKISEVEITKEKGLSGELTALKTCMRDACTAFDMGIENFNLPEFGLCFSPVTADFILDINCSQVLVTSKQPLAIRSEFQNFLTLKREESCKKMKGEISGDRQKCYVNISYGQSKDNISSSGLFEVGELFECSGTQFDTKLGTSEEFERKKKHAAINASAAAIKTGGSIAGMFLGGSKIGSVVGGAIDITTSIGFVIADVALFQDGRTTKESLTQSVITQGTSIVTSSINLIGAAKSMAKPKTSSIPTSSSGNRVIDLTDKKVEKAAQKTGQGLKAGGVAIDLVGNFVDLGMQSAIDTKQLEYEEKGIVSHSEFIDRDMGVGQVNKTASRRGNCFVGDDWFATENELILLQWL